MALSLYAAPSIEPVSLDDAKGHLRVDVADEDGLIAGLIESARQWVEAFTHRKLLTQTWDLKMDAFPCGEIVLPFPPVSAVSSITYVDTSGTTQTWSASLYTTDLPSGPEAMPGRIVPVYGGYFPSTRCVPNAVTVRFVCGYADEAAVPMSIRQAMLLLVGHWFAHRENVVVGNVSNIISETPVTVQALLTPYYVA